MVGLNDCLRVACFEIRFDPEFIRLSVFLSLAQMNGKVMISLFIYFDFRYMKFIYLHCGEETNLRTPRS